MIVGLFNLERKGRSHRREKFFVILASVTDERQDYAATGDCFRFAAFGASAGGVLADANVRGADKIIHALGFGQQGQRRGE